MRKTIPLPTQDELREWFRYDEATQRLVWRKRMSNTYPGMPAGKLDARGYVSVRFKGRYYYAHRLIFKLVHGVDPVEIDHKDTSTNDRLANLRNATSSQNNANKSAYGVSGVKGAYPVGKRFKAQIRGRYLGTFDTAEDANAAFGKAASADYGNYARVK